MPIEQIIGNHPENPYDAVLQLGWEASPYHMRPVAAITFVGADRASLIVQDVWQMHKIHPGLAERLLIDFQPNLNIVYSDIPGGNDVLQKLGKMADRLKGVTTAMLLNTFQQHPGTAGDFEAALHCKLRLVQMGGKLLSSLPAEMEWLIERRMETSIKPISS